MALLSRQLMAEAGLNLTANAATVTTGDLADNTDGKLIWVVNNGGTAATSLTPNDKTVKIAMALAKIFQALGLERGAGVVGDVQPAVNWAVTLTSSIPIPCEFPPVVFKFHLK